MNEGCTQIEANGKLIYLSQTEVTVIQQNIIRTMNYIHLASHTDSTVTSVTARAGMPLWALQPILIGLNNLSRPDAQQPMNISVTWNLAAYFMAPNANI